MLGFPYRPIVTRLSSVRLPLTCRMSFPRGDVFALVKEDPNAVRPRVATRPPRSRAPDFVRVHLSGWGLRPGISPKIQRSSPAGARRTSLRRASRHLPRSGSRGQQPIRARSAVGRTRGEGGDVEPQTCS